jgi:ArsR family transcriptional regulator
MGITKSNLFSKTDNRLALTAKALGHPARIAIIKHLLKVNACICNDLVDIIPLSQPTLSQHLKELKTAGIIKGNVEGASICYCINEKAIEPLKTLLEKISRHDNPICC